MSETPQEIVVRFLRGDAIPTEVSYEAIRAVLVTLAREQAVLQEWAVAAKRAEAERDMLRAEVVAWQSMAPQILASRVEAVLALHVEWHSIDVEPQCDECGKPWPCPTRRALEGEK